MVLKKYFPATVLVAVAVFLVSGCALKPAPDTSTPVKPTLGVIDMAKALQAHPRYREIGQLEKEYEILRQQLEQQASSSSGEPPAFAAGDSSGQKDAQEQEFNSRMAEKQNELQKQLQEKAEAVHKELGTQLQEFAEALDKEYQPRIFSLQLKMKTVQLSKEDLENAQKELDALQKEHSDKLAAKEKEFAVQMNGRMAPEQVAAEKDLAAYAGKLQTEIVQRTPDKAASLVPNATAASNSAMQQDLMQQLDKKRQEITGLREIILKDVTDKTASVANAQGLTAVLANVRTNLSAEDITQAVIAEFKK